MFDSSVPYPNASTEPLGAIESATCYAYPEDLVTRRFRRLFNEIERLQLLAEERGLIAGSR
jgi:hypothetical protein